MKAIWYSILMLVIITKLYNCRYLKGILLQKYGKSKLLAKAKRLDWMMSKNDDSICCMFSNLLFYRLLNLIEK